MSRIKGKATTDQRQPDVVVVGVDVGKDWLDVFCKPSENPFRVGNDGSGIFELRARCLAVSAGLVVMEATGRYHRPTYGCLHEAGIKVAVINPYRTRRLADVLGRLDGQNRRGSSS